MKKVNKEEYKIFISKYSNIKSEMTCICEPPMIFKSYNDEVVAKIQKYSESYDKTMKDIYYIKEDN